MAGETLLLPTWQRDNSYSTLTIGPVEFGPKTGVVVHLKDVVTDTVVDHKKGGGVDGGGLIPRGMALRKVDVEIEIWDAVGEALWDQAVPILMPVKDASKRQVWPVDHPSLRRHSISRCYVKITGEKPPDSRGVLIGRMTLWEDRSKPVGSKKPKQAVAVPTVQINPKIVQAPLLPGVQRPSQKVKP